MSYRKRLRVEGAALAGIGGVASLVLVAIVDAARERPWSTVGQLAVVAVLLAWLGPRSVRRAAGRAEEVPPARAAELSGEPTPLWHLPLVVGALVAAMVAPTGAWDAGLRVTAGAALVGFAQAVLLERVAAAEERRRGGGTLVRLPGSRILRGTRLGLVRGPGPRG